ncbi:hypothetical protein BKA58DRAFT_380869 [Alternaria rosae]|uniref:uncharacterized protein n=1 Tax=Alternaria rosae TaxID=1187941 RepID=UPI001E8D122F|nr:uncharacterized protein BKA58DRAFT_380869 [Alternaria rosae]KAH6876018.1 hypothetical protein BKA58DRAFT_380869 [Alternaria rosae]
MTDTSAPVETFASGRYSKRKRTQITYHLDELDVSDSESDFDTPQAKKRAVATSSRPLPKRKIFPFLNLPAEIRNIIYEYTLTDSSGINLVGVFKHKRRNVERISAKLQAELSQESGWSDSQRMNNGVRKTQEEPAPLVTSLLAVNKQIHQEGVDILYGKNEFIFTDSFALYNFMINLGPNRAKSLRTLRILGWLHGRAMKAYNHSCFSALVWATNITAFHIDSQIGWYRASKYGADQLYRDAFPWMEAVGMAKGKVDAIVDIIKFNEDHFDEHRGRYRWHTATQTSNEEMYAEFKTALRKSLGAQQQRVMAPTTSQTKRAKITKKVTEDEE